MTCAPIPSDVSLRIAKSCSDAAFGYTKAGLAAYENMVGQALDAWTDMASGRPVKMQQVSTPQPFPLPVAMATPWMANPFAAAAFNPWANTPFASWPMAFWMMSAGVPGTVAFPTANANQAAMDAAETAANAVNRAFSSYQTGGGHASWHLWPQGQAVLLALAFLPKTMQAPWAMMLRI
jgi:hypothetical protein